MQYLVIFTTKKRFETEGMPADFKEEHVKELVQGQVLYKQGLLRQSWELDLEQLDSKQHGAACIFEADSTQHLQGMIDTFPNVKTNYVDFQVFPLKPDPAYTQKPAPTQA